MPDREHCTHPASENVFDPTFLASLESLEPLATSFQAGHGGFWRVVPLGDERYGIYRLWEDPAHGDEPFAVLTDRASALLAAAFLPLVVATRSLWLHPADEGGYTLYREGRRVGRMPHRVDELTRALNLADALARTPTSLAGLLAAAGPEALTQAGKILKRGLLPTD